MNNNSRIIHISDEMSRTSAIKLIKTSLQENPGIMIVDLVDASFPLHRDFFLVLSKKFPKDRYVLRLKNEKLKELASSLGIQAEIVGLQAEFERSYSGTNLATHNMSMWEYFLYEMRRGWLWVKFLFKRKEKEPKTLYYQKRSAHVMLIISGLVLSVALLVFIFHFAVSRTIVTITPEIIVKTVSDNIVYRSESHSWSILNPQNTLKLKKLEFTTELAQKFRVEAIDPSSAMNARGVVTIYNTLTTPQELRPSTRFVSSDGSVFRTEEWVKIPGAKTLNGVTEIGITEVSLVADTHDESKKIIGARGNIAQGSDLVIPGLKFNRDKIYAKAKEDFSGGANPEKRILTQEEVKNFEKTLSEQLAKIARTEIDRKLLEESTKTGEEFALMIPDAIKLENMRFEIISGQQYGDVTDEVEIKWYVDIHATVFDKKATIAYLTDRFRDRIIQWTNKEWAIHPDTLRISNIVTRDEWDNDIKATLEMNASVIFDFENAASEGVRNLKMKIMWLSAQQAKERLMEEGDKIKEVEIDAYPFWVSGVSSNIDNIEFSVKK